MTDEEWENFAVEVLRSLGFQILTLPSYGVDGGRDFMVRHEEITYLVSCKHYISSGKHVGQDDEKNISDRLCQFAANGFIGFYSTGITSGLQTRLNGMCETLKCKYLILGPQLIIQAIQSMDTKILQSFGLYPHKYYMNVQDDEYKPLRCMICGKDILTDDNIPASLAGVAMCKDGKYDYVYGCKSCFINIQLYCEAHLEIEQALHVQVLQGWEKLVDEWIENGNIEPNGNFYKHRVDFLNLVRQRQLPQTEGNWYGIY